jgi:fructokinase
MTDRPTGYLLAIGESLVDAITTDFVINLSQAKHLSLHAGGSPANLCRFFQTCGGRARLVAAVGRDGLGTILLESLAQAGIDTSSIQQLSAHSTSLVVVGRSKGTPDFIAYRDADRYLQPVEDSLINGALVVHTTAFALSKAPAQQSILQAFEKAQSKGIDVSVDWNYAQPVWGENNNAHRVLQEIMVYQPLLKISMDDVSRFVEKDLSEEEAKDYLQSMPARVTCLTCGSRGVWFKTSESAWQHIPASKVTVVDSTGAGDAYWAGFLLQWILKQPAEECVKQGILTAAMRLEGKL